MHSSLESLRHCVFGGHRLFGGEEDALGSRGGVADLDSRCLGSSVGLHHVFTVDGRLVYVHLVGTVGRFQQERVAIGRLQLTTADKPARQESVRRYM
jgi:hypothetical protein